MGTPHPIAMTRHRLDLAHTAALKPAAAASSQLPPPQPAPASAAATQPRDQPRSQLPPPITGSSSSRSSSSSSSRSVHLLGINGRDQDGYDQDDDDDEGDEDDEEDDDEDDEDGAHLSFEDALTSDDFERVSAKSSDPSGSFITIDPPLPLPPPPKPPSSSSSRQATSSTGVDASSLSSSSLSGTMAGAHPSAVSPSARPPRLSLSSPASTSGTTANSILRNSTGSDSSSSRSGRAPLPPSIPPPTPTPSVSASMRTPRAGAGSPIIQVRSSSKARSPSPSQAVPLPPTGTVLSSATSGPSSHSKPAKAAALAHAASNLAKAFTHSVVAHLHHPRRSSASSGSHGGHGAGAASPSSPASPRTSTGGWGRAGQGPYGSEENVAAAANSSTSSISQPHEAGPTTNRSRSGSVASLGRATRGLGLGLGLGLGRGAASSLSLTMSKHDGSSCSSSGSLAAGSVGSAARRGSGQGSGGGLGGGQAMSQSRSAGVDGSRSAVLEAARTSAELMREHETGNVSGAAGGSAASGMAYRNRAGVKTRSPRSFSSPQFPAAVNTGVSGISSGPPTGGVPKTAGLATGGPPTHSPAPPTRVLAPPSLRSLSPVRPNLVGPVGTITPGSSSGLSSPGAVTPAGRRSIDAGMPLSSLKPSAFTGLAGASASASTSASTSSSSTSSLPPLLAKTILGAQPAGSAPFFVESGAGGSGHSSAGAASPRVGAMTAAGASGPLARASDVAGSASTMASPVGGSSGASTGVGLGLGLGLGIGGVDAAAGGQKAVVASPASATSLLASVSPSGPMPSTERSMLRVPGGVTIPARTGLGRNSTSSDASGRGPAGVLASPSSPMAGAMAPAVDGMHIPHQLLEGECFVKVTQKKSRDRVFKLDVDSGRILWESKTKNWIDVDLISEIRGGVDAELAIRECGMDPSDELIRSRWMSIHYKRPGAYKVVHLLANSRKQLLRWRNTLEALQRMQNEILLGFAGDSNWYSHGRSEPTSSDASSTPGSSAPTPVVPRPLGSWELFARREEYWLRQHWRISDPDKKEFLNLEEIIKVCRRLGINAPKEDIREHFNAADIAQRGALTFDDFVRFFRFLQGRREVEHIFEHWADVERVEEDVRSSQYQGQGIRRRRSASAPYPQHRRRWPASGNVVAWTDETASAASTASPMAASTMSPLSPMSTAESVLRPVQMQARIQSPTLAEDPEPMDAADRERVGSAEEAPSANVTATQDAVARRPLADGLTWQTSGGTLRRRPRKWSIGGLLYAGTAAPATTSGGANAPTASLADGATAAAAATMPSFGGAMSQGGLTSSHPNISLAPTTGNSAVQAYSKLVHTVASPATDVGRLGLSRGAFGDFLREEQKLTDLPEDEISALFNKYRSLDSGAIHLRMFTAFLMSPDNALIVDQCPFLIQTARANGKRAAGLGCRAITAFLPPPPKEPVLVQNSEAPRSETQATLAVDPAARALPQVVEPPSGSDSGFSLPGDAERQQQHFMDGLTSSVASLSSRSAATSITAVEEAESDEVEEERRQLQERTSSSSGANARDRQGPVAPIQPQSAGLYAPHNGLIFHDMTRPLSEYLISSSHNTYLIGAQYKGDSTIEGYIRALKGGARCVEIDCHRGKDNTPVVTHARSLVKPIPFVDVIETLGRYAFVTNPYPLIVSLELHIEVALQDEVVRILRERLGDKLLSAPLPDRPNDGQLPSPEELKGKILIKAKNLYVSESNRRKAESGQRSEVMAVELDNSDDEATGTETNESEGGTETIIMSTIRRMTGRKKNNNGHANKPLSASLAALLVYTTGVDFEWWSDGHEYKVEHMISMHDKKATKVIKKSKEALVKHNMTHLTRIWPKFDSLARAASANFLPHDMWAGGCQLAAMNWQKPDLGMQINYAMFSRNGKCGYVLKPEALRLEDECRDSSDRLRFSIDITIISAQQLPRFTDVSRDKDSDSDVIDPHVVLSILTPEAWGPQPASDINRTFLGGVSPPLGTPSGATVTGFDFEPPRRSTTALSFAASTATSSPHVSNRRMRRSDSVSSVTSLSGGAGGGRRTTRLATETIKGNGFNPIWNQKLSIVLEVPSGDSTLANAAEYVGDEAMGRPDDIRGLSRGLLDLCFVKFEVCDKELDSSCLATSCVPLGSIQQGYRHVPLYDGDLYQYRFSTLFVHIDTRYVGIFPCSNR